MGRRDRLRTKAVQSNAGVIDDEVDAFGVRLFKVLCQILDAGLVRDVQVVVLDLCKPAVCFQRFGLLELRVLLELLQRGLASALVTCCEVDEERAIVEGRFGILNSQLADYGKTNAMAALEGFEYVASRLTLFAQVTTPIL